MRGTLVGVVGVVLTSTVALGGPRPAPDPDLGGPPNRHDHGSLSAPVPDNSLDRTAILNGIASVRTKIMACGDQLAVGGTLRAKVVLAPNGKVESATAEGIDDAALQACVVKVIKTVRFAKSVNGGAFSFPFVFQAADLSDTLDATVMGQGLVKLEAKIAACHKAGKITMLRPQALKIDVDAAGKVTKAWSYAPSGDAKTDACVERVFKTARFGKTADGGSFTYPRPVAANPGASTDPLATIGTPTDPFASSGAATSVTVSGELDPAVLAATVNRAMVAISRCGDASAINGKVSATVQVGADGKVTSVTASGSGDAKLDACVASVLKTLTFPKSKAGSFTYPFVFTHDPLATISTPPADPFATATVTGELDRAAIAATIARYKATITRCGDASTVNGKVTAKVQVGADGKVTSATADGSGDAKLDACVASVVKTLTFPKSKAGGSFTYPFVFTHDAGGTPVDPFGASSVDNLGPADITDGVAKVKAKILACGDASKAGGTVKVTVRVGAGGTVTSAIAEGSTDAALNTCVAAVMKTATFATKKNGGAFSYPFVFGSPADAKPSPLPPPPTSGLAESLDRAMISDGITKVKAAISACGDGKTKGVVKISVAVAPAGTVMSAKVTQAPSDALGTCVSGAISKATFAKTAQGGSFSYPFVF